MPERTPAADRTNLPGILLLIVGVLNIIGSLFRLVHGAQGMMLTHEQRQEMEREAAAQQSPEQQEQMKQFGWSMTKVLDVFFGVLLAWGGLALVAGIVTLIGGLQMRSLHSYGLAVTAS